MVSGEDRTNTADQGAARRKAGGPKKKSISHSVRASLHFSVRNKKLEETSVEAAMVVEWERWGCFNPHKKLPNSPPIPSPL